MFGLSDNKNQDNADDPYVMPAPSAPVDDTGSTDAPVSAAPTTAYSETAETEPLAPAFAPTAPPVPSPPPAISEAVAATPPPEPTLNNATPAPPTEPEPAPAPASPDPLPNDKPSAAALMGGGSDDNLLKMKQQALQSLAPLIDHLEQTPEEKFKTTMMLIQASDNAELVKEAYEAANQIKDDKVRAQALLDVVNEINYFTHKDK